MNLTDIRARNYNLPQGNKMELKYFLGNITPSILSTTTFIVGLSMIEIVKSILGHRPENLKCWNCSLHQPSFTFSYAKAGPSQVFNSKQFTLWDKVSISGPKKVKDIVEEVSKSLDTMISSITTRSFTLYHTRRSLPGQVSIENLKESVPESLLKVDKDVTYIFLFAKTKEKDNNVITIKYKINV